MRYFTCISHKKHQYIFHNILFSLLCILTLIGAAACIGSTSTPAPPKTHSATSTVVGSNGAGLATTSTSTAALPLGPQPCPNAVSSATYWDPIIGTQSGISAVGRVTCAYLTGTSSLQTLILVGYSGTGRIIDCYVYDNITNPSPTKLFALQGLYKGDVKISAYNTVLTAEVDQASSINKNVPNAGLTLDLFREFKWSLAANTFVPVSFPGIFPDLTRYQAETDQQQVNQGHDPWKLQAALVASSLAVSLLKWPTNTTTTLVSGGGTHDTDAIVNVKNNRAASLSSSIKVALSRLEGNTNGGIWIATGVESIGMSITSPQIRDSLSSPVTVTGTGSAFEGVIGRITVLDHLYNDIGHAQAKGMIGNGNTTFSANVSYTASFKGGTQEGLLALYSYSNADGSIAGAVIVKELLSA